MARKKQEESGGGGAPAWMATFSDLMNLLLCFFVLLFAMSSVDANKWEQVVASMTSAFSIFSSGSTSIGHGTLVGIGTSQLSNLDEYYTSMGQTSQDNGDDQRDTSQPGSNGENQGGANQDPELGGKQQNPESGGKQQDSEVGGKTLQEQLAALGKEETEEMVDSVSELTERYNIGDLLEVSMDGKITLVKCIRSTLIIGSSASRLARMVPP